MSVGYPDPTVLYDVTEQVEEALTFAPILGLHPGSYPVAARHAASAALHEAADILRERAHEHDAPRGLHEAARALLDEADRMAPEDRGASCP